jgi:L-ascorbate metabolism protein UlaG (beta-lactamase superfamily)
MTTKYKLGKSTVAEPLINQWAVWSDLISPAPYSMHANHYQIPTLNSYLQNPDLHLKAARNPKLIGGPYVDIPKERKHEVEALLESTKQQVNKELAQAIVQLYNILDKEAKGQSLEPYYHKVPEQLKGYVELLYDYYNHPIVRLIEPFLYRSKYYNEHLQSFRLFQLERDDKRRFFLNTPHLLEQNEIDWKINFSHPNVDQFFSLDSEPRALGEIKELLGLTEQQTKLLETMLSPEQVARRERWTGSKPRIRYLGHACVLVEWNGISIMTDPWVGAWPREGGMERISFEDLPEHIDFALITHGHHDHFVSETLLRLRHRLGTLVVPKSFGLFYADVSLKLAAQQIGFRHVIEVESLDSIPIPDGEIVGIPFFGEHADLPHAKAGYVVRCGQEKVLFAADSNCVEPRIYTNVCNTLGDIQTVFLGMECVGAPLSWLYGALLPAKVQHAYDKSRRTKGSDASAAMALLKAVKGKRVYIYALGSEPWFNYSMGLGLSEDALQIKEATKVLAAAQEMGLLDAQRPYGYQEMSL